MEGKDQCATVKRVHHEQVVITGSSKGLGRALADEFLRLGDGVVICSRSQEAVDETAESLSEKHPSMVVRGTVCDVSDLGKSPPCLTSMELAKLCMHISC